MSKRFSSTVAGGSIIITLTGIISRGFGFIRELIYATIFGLQADYEIYLVGSILALSINTAVYYLAQNYFIPSYTGYSADRKKSAQFLVNTFWLFVLLSFAFALLLFVFTPVIINSYMSYELSEHLHQTAYSIFRIFLITIPLNAAYSILTAYLQSKFDFKSPAVSTLFLNLSIIILVLIFNKILGVFSIAVGYLLGTLLQLLFLFLILGKEEKVIFLKFNFNLSGTGRLNLILGFTILIEVINQIYPLIDRYFYDKVERGGIAALNYASNVYILPISIISIAISTAVFPKLSENLSTNSLKELFERLDNFFRINFFLFVPVAFIFFLYGETIIGILFQRGEFKFNDTLMTADVLKYYALSIIFYSAYAVLNKLMYSAKLVKHLLIIASAGFLIKIILSFSLVNSLQQNGLALSSSVSYIFFFAASFAVAFKMIKLERKNLVYAEFAVSILNALLSWMLVSILNPQSFTGSSLLNGSIAVLFFGSIYLFNAWILKDKSIDIFRAAFRSLKESF
ncbi:MAG: oligosaccharide flippase family protein [Ignavibacteria bacterium]